MIYRSRFNKSPVHCVINIAINILILTNFIEGRNATCLTKNKLFFWPTIYWFLLFCRPSLSTHFHWHCFRHIKCKYFITNNTARELWLRVFHLVKLLPSLNARYEVETLRSRYLQLRVAGVRQHCGDLFNKFLQRDKSDINAVVRSHPRRRCRRPYGISRVISRRASRSNEIPRETTRTFSHLGSSASCDATS